MKTRFKVGAVVLLLLIIGAASLFFYARGRGFSAREQPSGLEVFMARSARKLATPASAMTLKNPEPVTEENAREAREHFIEHCAVCHGLDGRGETTFGRNMYPKVPNLAADGTQQLSDGELFYIISNGIRLSGMPAFGGEDSPQSMWHLVSFIRRLPQLSPEEIEQLKKLAEGSAEEHANMSDAQMKEEEAKKDGEAVAKPTPTVAKKPRRPKPHTHAPGTPPH